ncbi:MAG: hypothetical protein COA99_07760 [Moraxellaceae bacterium]|nr:MAG: hypothetical protein COA99_07760 [Moraxellaceae bacterium]
MNDLSMKPLKEDLVHREQSGKRKKPPSAPSTQPIVVLLLLIVAVAGSAGGWYLWQQLQIVSGKLENSTLALADSETALGSLKSELDVRNDSISKQKGETASTLEELEHEIRKLWDISNKRNKKAISANKSSVNKLSSSIKTQTSELAVQIKAVSALSVKVTQQQREFAKGQKANVTLSSTVASLQDQVANLSVENDMLRTLSVEQGKLLQGVKNDGLQSQVNELQQAIKAIDAHRRQVNGRLDRLGRELDTLYPKK